MGTQVKITLAALNVELSPAERIVTLTPDYDTIPVGRASKSPSKGLQGAVDNTWFDSPVMSRHHAEIIFNPDARTVVIQDIGSMHGTYLNNFQLARESPMTIGKGDIVTFGAEVRRGQETFPACSFKVAYEFVPYNKTSNTYALPEFSEIEDEDEEEEQFSENNSTKCQQPSSEDGVSVDSRPLKLSPHVDAIDLTRDDSPIVRGSSSIVDLTGDAPAGNPSDMVRPPLAPHNTNSNPTGTYSCTTAVIVDSDEEDEDEDEDVEVYPFLAEKMDAFYSESEEESEEAESDGSGSEGFDMDEVEDSEDGESEIHESPAPDGEPNAVSVPEPFISNVRTEVADSQHFLDETDDDDSDFGLSEAGQAGIEALFEDGLLESTRGRTDEMENTTTKNASQNLQASAPSQPAPSAHIFFDRDETEELVVPEDQPSSVFGNRRQPSPSDAAMVKPSALTNSAPVISKSSMTTTSRNLGELSGKEAFFSAREANKAVLQGNSQPPMWIPDLAMNSSTEQLDRSGWASLTETNPAPKYVPVPSAYSRPRHLPAQTDFGEYRSEACSDMALMDAAFPTRESCSFLDNPNPYPIHDRAPSPLFDMTSAVSFNLSKESRASASANKSRSRVSIDDIIEGSSAPQPPKSLKRKAADISDEVEAELKVWANSPSSAETGKDVVTAQDPSPSEKAKEAVVLDRAPEPRPSKRFKKVMEKLGYAALGGVAVGAGLFGALVATAPEFL